MMFQRFSNNSHGVAVNLSSMDITMLGIDTVGYSAADIKNTIAEACMLPLRELPFELQMTVSNAEVCHYY